MSMPQGKPEIEAKFVLPLNIGRALKSREYDRKNYQLQAYAGDFRIRVLGDNTTILGIKLATADPLERQEIEREGANGSILREWIDFEDLPVVSKYRTVLTSSHGLVVTLDQYLTNTHDGATEAYVLEAEGLREYVTSFEPPHGAINVTAEPAWKAQTIASNGLPRVPGYVITAAFQTG